MSTSSQLGYCPNLTSLTQITQHNYGQNELSYGSTSMPGPNWLEIQKILDEPIQGTSYQTPKVNPMRLIPKIHSWGCRIGGHLNKLSHNQ